MEPIQDAPSRGAFVMAVQQEWVRIIEDAKRREDKAWRAFLYNDGRRVLDLIDPWLQVPDGL